MFKLVRSISLTLGLIVLLIELLRGVVDTALLTDVTKSRASFIIQDGQYRETQVSQVGTFTTSSDVTDAIDSHSPSKDGKDNGSSPAGNSTLGFSSITALTSRSSTWRNKGLLRAASLTGLNVRTIEEPRWTPEDVDAFESARNETMSRGAAQAWMSHVNVLKVFLNSNDTTTLILEDDVDWDVNIKQQMSEVSVHLQDHYASSGLDIGLEPADLSREYPYGISTWDVLWLGHCGNSFNEWSSTPIAPPPSLQPDGRRVAHLQNTTITYHDQSAPQSEILDSHLLPFSTANNHQIPQRGIFSPAAPICTFAYAVTKSSASRILDEVTRSGLVESAFDVKLYSLCRWGGLRCVSVLPEVFHHQETAAKGGGSLIKSVDGVGENVSNNEENGNNKDQDAKERWTANIRYSARCNSEAELEKSADKIGRTDNGYRRWLGKGKKLMWKTCLAPLQDNDAGERD